MIKQRNRDPHVTFQRRSYQTQIHDENIILILRSYRGHECSRHIYCSMEIHSHAKHNMNMLKNKTAVARTESHVINPINLTLSSKVNVVSGSWMYATHPLIVIHPCAKYGNVKMWQQTEVMGRTWRHDKSLLNDFEVKDQCRIGIMNVCDTSFHGDTSMCQIW